MKNSTINNIAFQTVGMLIIIGACLYLTLNKMLHPLAFMFIIIIGCPWIKNLYHDIQRLQFDNVRKLKKHLPKIGCAIESMETIENSTDIRIVGKFQNETFHFYLTPGNAYVTICDPAWLRVPVSDPNALKFMEAINVTNNICGPTVVFSVPDRDGIRFIHTLCHTIVPNQYIDSFLNSTLIQILERKEHLRENFKDYPWLSPHRNKPIGFVATAEERSHETADSSGPAPKDESLQEN